MLNILCLHKKELIYIGVFCDKINKKHAELPMFDWRYSKTVCVNKSNMSNNQLLTCGSVVPKWVLKT